MKRKGMIIMLKLLIEKDKTDIGEELADRLVKNITFAAVDKKENDKYLVLLITPLRKKRYAGNIRKEALRLVKRTVDTIACYILYNMPEKYISELVENELAGTEYIDKACVVKLIQDGIAARLKENVKRSRKKSWYTAIYRRVLENMLECGMFAVNSFIRFRLDDFKQYINDQATVMLTCIANEIKYMEFIAMLQHFVDERKPKLYEMNVNVDNNSYMLTDGDGAPIDISVYEAAKRDGIDKEDLLIGILLTAAPVRIRVCADDSFFDTELFSTMSNIFGDRIVVDYARNDR